MCRLRCDTQPGPFAFPEIKFRAPPFYTYHANDCISSRYGKVLVFTNVERTELPKIWIKGTERLKLLRRTLRNRHALARNVRELHLSGFQALYEKASMEQEEIVNLVASLVMACPNLERLTGFDIPFTSSFDRLSHALSTREKLKERVWVLGDANSSAIEDGEDAMGAYYSTASDPTERFLGLNSRHSQLSALVFHQEPGQDFAPPSFRAIIGTTQQYPALRHLSISGLTGASFPNLALCSLPPNLQSLRLENLSSVNDKGLQRFMTSQLAISIEKLTLINLEITSLTTLSTIFSPHLAHLKQFSFVQYQAPTQSDDTPTEDFDSSSLQYIHWELRSQADLSPNLFPRSTLSTPLSPSFHFPSKGPKCCLATSLLAASIEDGAFPSLRKIRIPYDPQGVIQALCRPLGSALLPSDATFLQASSRMRGPNEFQIMTDGNGIPSPTTPGFPMSLPLLSPRADSVMSSPTSMRSSGCELLTPMRSRLAAHSRILAARKEPFITFRIYDSEGVLRLERCSAGFIGTIGSKITYDIKIDRTKGSSISKDEDLDRSEWIAATEEFLYEDEPENVGLEQRWMNCGHPIGGKASRNMASIMEMF